MDFSSHQLGHQSDSDGGMSADEKTPLVAGGSSVKNSTTLAKEALENVLDLGGLTWSQWMITMACGFANAADAVEILCISFVITTTAECDLGLTEHRKGYVTSSLFLGMMLGGWMWGSASDQMGRKRTLLAAMVFNFFFSFGSAFSVNFWMFIGMRFASGLGIGGSIPILFNYCGEMVPAKFRGRMLSLVACFWMVGGVLVAALAWAIVSPASCPNDSSSLSLKEICIEQAKLDCGWITVAWGPVKTWRLFTGCCSLLSLVVIIWLTFLPESPRWYVSQGNVRSAVEGVRRMYSSKQLQEVESALKSMDNVHVNCIEAPEQEGTLMASVARSFRVFGAQFSQLFNREFRRRTILLSIIWFGLSFGFYGLSMWLPSYFRNGGVDTDSNIYMLSFFVNLSNFPGNVFCLLFLDRVGRRATLSISMFLSATCVLFLFFISGSTGSTVFSCVFSGLSIAGWNAVDVISSEVYPTILRGTAFGLMAGLGRLGSICGNLVFGEVGGNNKLLPLLLCSACIFMAAIATPFLPNMAGRKLD
eukprot:m.170285 g.170285  ORF g.170285 m.170285 type:complete len:533 (+) comp17824_c0_seq9:304-1902(+)